MGLLESTEEVFPKQVNDHLANIPGVLPDVPLMTPLFTYIFYSFSLSDLIDTPLPD